MARPTRNTVEYFPHQCSHGKSMAILTAKYGNDGYAFWFRLLEVLGKTENHYLNLAEEMEQEFLAAETLVTREKMLDIIELLSKLGSIDKDLWLNDNIIWSQKFVDNIASVYNKRTSEIPSKPITDSGTIVSGAETQVSGSDNPQSKVKYSRVKESSSDNSEKTVPDSIEITQKLKDYATKIGYRGNLAEFINDFLDKCRDSEKYRYTDYNRALKNWLKKEVEKGMLVPDPFNLSKDHYEFGKEEGYDKDDIEYITQMFVDRHKARSTKLKDWSAEWRNWVRNQARFSG